MKNKHLNWSWVLAERSRGLVRGRVWRKYVFEFYLFTRVSISQHLNHMYVHNYQLKCYISHVMWTLRNS